MTMTLQRTGSPVAFWDAANVLANGTSSPHQVPRLAEQLVFYVTSVGASTFTVEVAHHGALTPEGNEPDESTPPDDAHFYTLNYLNTPCSIAVAANGRQALLIPDFEPAWVRLRSSAASSSVTAGFEATGE